MMRKLLIASAVAAGTMLGVSGQASAACGTVSIAEMNWASAQLMANVDKIILESGYGCKVDIVPGDTMPTFTSMNEKGQPDVAGELWINAVANPLNAQAKAEVAFIQYQRARLQALGEGWWLLPNTMKAHPELKTVLDVLERPDLFPHPGRSVKRWLPYVSFRVGLPAIKQQPFPGF
jgi:glycine betaine/proline transport system substrate-binding protein